MPGGADKPSAKPAEFAYEPPGAMRVSRPMNTLPKNRSDHRRPNLRRVWRGLAALGLAATVGLNSGCLLLAAGAGAGTVAYVRGELTASLGNELGAVAKATGRAVEQLKFAKISEREDALSAKFTTRTAQDKKIEIELTKVGEKLTKVQIRVGGFGDETVAMSVLEKIKANL